MSTSTVVLPSVRVALDALVDYAGLFPPARLDMDVAVAEYARERRGAQAWMLGRFILPISRLGELLADLANDAAPLDLSLIVDVDPEPRAWLASLQSRLSDVARLRDCEPRVRVGALEVLLPAPLSQRETFDAPLGQLHAALDRAGLSDLPVYAEPPRGPGWLESLADTLCAAARAKVGAKLRCGGVTAGAFPSVREVAAFVRAAHGAGVSFKATAGLHHPVRHVDPATGFPMHGFLNLLAAAALAPGLDIATLDGAVAEEDPAAFVFDDRGFAWREHHVSIADLEKARKHAFVGYGSCSFAEPVDDLIALNVLPAS